MGDQDRAAAEFLRRVTVAADDLAQNPDYTKIATEHVNAMSGRGLSVLDQIIIPVLTLRLAINAMVAKKLITEAEAKTCCDVFGGFIQNWKPLNKAHLNG